MIGTRSGSLPYSGGLISSSRGSNNTPDTATASTGLLPNDRLTTLLQRIDALEQYNSDRR